MTYDKTSHRWVLEVEDTREISESVESEYGGKQNAERELKKQSRTLYLYIYNRIPSSNKDFIEYNLAKCDELKNPLKEALLAQLEYDLKAGGNDVDKQAGINFGTGSIIPRVSQKERQVAIEAIEILENASGSINIFFPADYNQYLSSTRYIDFDY